MKAILIIVGCLIVFTSCNPVTVPTATKAENFNYKQAKTIIASQSKVRKKQLKQAKKNRKQELQEMKALSRK